MTIKQRLKLELYMVLLNMDLAKMTENEATLAHHLAIDDETTDALTKRARRDYAAMCRAAKLKPKTFQAMTALARHGRLYLLKQKATNPCNAAGCGCLQGRPTPEDKGMCLCGHSHFRHTIRIPKKALA